MTTTSTYANGYLPMSLLVELSWAPGMRLLPSAAAAMGRLDVAFHAKFGRHLVINEAYRDYATQSEYKARTKLPRTDPRWLPSAATPGTSVHGLALAVDLGGLRGFTSTKYAWLATNAPTYGWLQPAMYQATGKYPEYWHWEYDQATDHHVDPAPNPQEEDDIMSGPFIARVNAGPEAGHTFLVDVPAGVVARFPNTETRQTIATLLGLEERRVDQRTIDVVRHMAQLVLEKVTGRHTQSELLADGSIGFPGP